jgi:dUTP pyrophosphatase
MYLRYAKIRDVKDPQRANYGDAGMDFYIPNDFEPTVMKFGDKLLIQSGIKLEIPIGWAMVFFNKSGVATKRGLIVGAQVIDHGYTGEVGLHVVCAADSTTVLEPGQKLVQGLMLQVGAFIPQLVNEEALYHDVPALGSNRGSGGYGSTGV